MFYPKAPKNPNKRLPVTPDGTPAITGYYPDVIRGTSRGGPRKTPPAYVGMYGNTPYVASWQQFDKAIFKQHTILAHQSSTWVPDKSVVQRQDGLHDPLADGPVAPTYRMISRNYRIQGGTSNTANLDNNVVKFSPYGMQDGVTYIDTIDPIKSNPKINPVGPGMTYTESSQFQVPPSGPHGIHARTPLHKLNQVQANTLNRNKVQQKGTRQNRLANSNYAGQSYSATTQTLGGATVVQTQGSGRRGLR